MSLLGIIVQNPSNQLGIGKLIELNEEEATVEYFISLGNRIKKKMPVSDLKRVALPRQTRCYLWLEDKQNWQVGRIFERDQELQSYRLDFPDGKSILAPETDIFVRCNLPIDDPVEILAMKGQETPYLYEQRSLFTRSLINQRAVSRGMTGLISANIELYPHQVEVVRRVLEDPIQRYLLADEVGLGKTIEAGVILRQFLLDQPREKALIIVPNYLLNQWQKELENKFYISEFSDRVELLSIDDWRNISPNISYGLVIIDEAHNIAAMMSELSKFQCFNTIKSVAYKSDRLLLLSATPVLNQEQNLLVMLNFLDQKNYPIQDLKTFQEKVEKNQEIGQILLDFKKEEKSLLIEGKARQLKELLPQDNYLLEQLEKLEKCLKNDKLETEKGQLIEVIRTHIIETYRLYHRMLKNCREALEDVIFERNLTPQIEYDLDERAFELRELLDEYRNIAPKTPEYIKLFLLLFNASGSWLGVLKQLISIRLNSLDKKDQKTLERDWGKKNLKIITKTDIFTGEQKLLNKIINLIDTPSEDGDKLELLKLILLYHLSDILELQGYRSKPDRLLELVQQRIKNPFQSDKFPKLVIFTNFYSAGLELVNYLTKCFGKTAVTYHLTGETRNKIDENLEEFRTNPSCFLLVCDQSGEEGINLQFADGLIHFDLSWSPNNLEQRLGRFDRIGGKINLKSWILIGLEDSPQEAHYHILQDGFQLFNQSISALQFYSENKINSLENILFESNLYGDNKEKLQELIKNIQQEIQQEKIRINEQNIFHEIDLNEDNAHQYFTQLEQYDSQHKVIKRAVDGVLCEALQFKNEADVNLDEVYEYTYKISGRRQTLVPLNQLKDYFVPLLNKPGTYNRRIANQNKGVKLYRIGEQLIDTLAKYVHWDDRGQAFALWRCDEKWAENNLDEWVGFRFDYIIEADLSKVKETLDKTKFINLNFEAIKRQADGLFPPRWESIFLDLNFHKVEDENLLRTLQYNYRDKKDYNLAKNRLPILDQYINPEQWPEICQNARQKSEKILRQTPDFIEWCENHSNLAEEKLETRISQLKLQEKNLENSKELQLEIALQDVLIEAIKTPKIKADSVGFIIVSGNKPEVDK
jgi:ATP-dependent helicase HepA